MEQCITYGSVYGTTKRYAEAFAEQTGTVCLNYEELTALTGVRRVIHFGGLHAGGVLGLKKVLGLLPADADLWVVTVGLVDVEDPTNIEMTRKMVRIQMPKERYDETKSVPLRGGIDYAKLTPKSRRSARDRIVIETDEKAVDFVNPATLEPILLKPGESSKE